MVSPKKCGALPGRAVVERRTLSGELPLERPPVLEIAARTRRKGASLLDLNSGVSSSSPPSGIRFANWSKVHCILKWHYGGGNIRSCSAAEAEGGCFWVSSWFAGSGVQVDDAVLVLVLSSFGCFLYKYQGKWWNWKRTSFFFCGGVRHSASVGNDVRGKNEQISPGKFLWMYRCCSLVNQNW